MESSSQKELIRKVFDSEVAGYELIKDLHDAWLFSRMHYFIAQHVIAESGLAGKSVLDVGCGIGLQSFLYASAGAAVTGIDISPESIAEASRKSDQLEDSIRNVFLYPSHKFVRRYNARVSKLLQGQMRTPPRAPIFQLGDARELPFSEGTFDHVNCCGSVLSFVPDYRRAFAEFHRVLKTRGTYVIEVKQSCNFDIVWALLGHWIGSSWTYGNLRAEQFTSVKCWLNEHMNIRFPLKTFGDGYLDAVLFARRKLLKELISAGLPPATVFNILSVTNLIPSNILRRPEPSIPIKALFSAFAAVEKLLPGLPGCNILIMGKKSGLPDAGALSSHKD